MVVPPWWGVRRRARRAARGGGQGIRTLECGVTALTVFKTVAFGRSASPPCAVGHPGARRRPAIVPARTPRPGAGAGVGSVLPPLLGAARGHHVQAVDDGDPGE